MKYKTNMKKEKKIYESPQLTVVEFRVERGFAESTGVWAAQQAVQTFVDQQMLMEAQNLTEDNQLAAGYMTNQDETQPGGSTGWQYSSGGWF